MTGALFKIFIISNALGYLLVNGYPLGAPPEACNNLLPQHNRIPSPNFIPYSIDYTNISSNGYIPGHTYGIILHGFGPYFKGFMIQGRVQGTGNPIGNFSVGTNYQSLCIGNSAATHTNRYNKASVILSWTAPPAGTGSIYFSYTFVKDYFEFFPNQQTRTINEATSTLRPPMATDNNLSDNNNRCRNDSDCSDHDKTIAIAKCNQITGRCNCSLPSCHDYNSMTNKCELKSCHEIVLIDNEHAISCVNKGSKNKLTALLLNMISFTGATNFYLGNYGLAVGQLLLFNIMIFTCVLRMCSCCVLSYVFCCDKDPEEFCKRCCCCNKKGKIGSAYTTAEVLLILLSLAELIWMIHDFIKIAINGKLDGDGCFLGDDTIDLIQNLAINTLEVGS